MVTTGNSKHCGVGEKMVDVYSGYDEDDFEELVESEESVLPPSAKKPHNRAVSLQATKKKTGGSK